MVSSTSQWCQSGDTSMYLQKMFISVAKTWRRKAVRITAATFVAAGCMVADLPIGTAAAHAGEGFFEKIGDGWRKGKWVPGLPDVKPQSWQEVVFPICWGSPQDCRDDNDKKKDQTVARLPQPSVSVSYRVDCRDSRYWP